MTVLLEYLVSSAAKFSNFVALANVNITLLKSMFLFSRCLRQIIIYLIFVLLQVSQWYNLVVFTASLEVSHAHCTVMCAKCIVD